MNARVDMWLAVILSILAIVITPYVYPKWIVAAITVIVCAVYYLKDSKFPAIGLGIVAILYGAELISQMVFLSTIAIIILGEAAYRLTPSQKKENKFLTFLIVSAIALASIKVFLSYPIALVPITGILVAAMLKVVLKNREDALLLECIGTAMTMFLFEDISYIANYEVIATAVVISFIFGFIAYKMRAADLSGLFSAALMGILIIVFTDPRWFIVMLIFFILGSGFTKYKYEIKKREGVAESRGGMRGFLNVYANGLVSLAAAVLFGIYHDPIWIALFLGSISAAMADTTASELGMLGKTPRLITTLKPVPKGTDGGVTLLGEAAAVIAAIILCAAAYLLGVATLEIAVICILAGFVGTNVDSLVGATLEIKGKIHNTGTNFICTLSGGLFAMALYALLHMNVF